MDEPNERAQLAEQCGRALMTDEETRIILDGLSDDATDEAKAYMRGQLLAVMQVRLSIVEQASNGSSPAQALFVDILRNTRAANV